MVTDILKFVSWAIVHILGGLFLFALSLKPEFSAEIGLALALSLTFITLGLDASYFKGSFNMSMDKTAFYIVASLVLVLLMIVIPTAFSFALAGTVVSITALTLIKFLIGYLYFSDLL